MDILEQMITRAKAHPQRIVLPEGDEPRTLEAANILLREDRDVRFIVAFFAEGYDTIAKSEQCVVRAHTHVFTRVVNGTTLTYDDVTCLCELTTKDLHAKTFAF